MKIISLLCRLYLLLDGFKLVSVSEISSSLGQGKRKTILNNFKNGNIRVYITYYESCECEAIYLCA